MSENHPAHNAACKSDEHTKHLCYFVSYGYHEDKPEEYRDLVDTPRYKCKFCARTAHNKESLCHPLPL